MSMTRTTTQRKYSLRPIESRAEVTMKRNKKTTQILLIIAACFGVSWLPYHAYTIGTYAFTSCARRVPLAAVLT